MVSKYNINICKNLMFINNFILTFIFLLFLYIIVPKGNWDIHFGGDQAELYLSASKI